MLSVDHEDLPRFAELEAEYEILGELGRGGTAVVYLARERELGRKIAIKVIRATYVEDEEAAARLTREARTIGGLQHPNIVMLYGTRRLRDRSLALIMQYVEGHTLKREVRDSGPLPFERVEQVLRDVGAALGYAHRHRIVHRDIKPENIYIDDETGIARLSDFGIARAWDSDSSLTLEGAAIGTPAYMSPEQIDGAPLDGRSDLYSLGLVGYEMLTGMRPWAGETLFSIVVKQKHEELQSLALLRPGIPRNLQVAVEGAIRKKAERRWQDADAFLRVLSGRAAPERPVRLVGAATEADITIEPLPADITDAGSATVKFHRCAAPAPALIEHPDARVTVPAEREVTAPPAASPPVLLLPDVRAAAPAAESSPVPQRIQKGPLATLADRLPIRWPLMAAAAMIVVIGLAAPLAYSRLTGDTTAPAGVQGTDAAAPADPASTPPPPPGPVGPPALALVVMGDLQAGPVGDPLADPLVVRVEDAEGRPVSGATVEFVVAGGASQIEPATALTDSAGSASARWIPQSPGVHRVEARIAGVVGEVAFHARALARPPARLAAESPTQLRGTVGSSSRLAVRVLDDRGNPVPGVQIQFGVRSGGGRMQPATPVTGVDGIARADWVPTSAGDQEVIAVVPELAGANVLFSGSASAASLAIRRTVAVGGTHTCALGGDGVASCWGGNDNGQLGDGSSSRRASPVRVAAPEQLATIASGVAHSCAVGVSGSVYCWGSNTSGQLGDGSRSGRARPVRVNTEERMASVAVGMGHSCALDDGGRLFCWGTNSSGQLGDGTQVDRTSPVRAGGTRVFRSVAVGWAHTCALTADGTPWCWGRNGSGELGDGSTATRTEPVRVTGGHRFAAVAAGSAHSCGLLGDGAVLCWGQNSNGQLGSGNTNSSTAPVNVDAPVTFSALAAGGVHSCALGRDGTVHCWGRNNYGQLGDGTSEDRASPAPVAGGLRFSSIHANGAHSCGSAAGGALYCWGYNVEGQVGDGTRSNQPRPVPAGREG